MTTKLRQNLVNHVVIGIDASSSMTPLRGEVIRVVDGQIAHLARRSKELDQETRVTIYTFATTAECVIYDMDVLRLPSIAEFYRPNGWTALVDATVLAMDDLAMTPEKYGDHAFLLFMVTDGEENRSRPQNLRALPGRLAESSLPDNWTVAVLVPNKFGEHEAKKFGFPANNIAIWNATNAEGVAEAGETIRQATDRFMDNRARGIRRSTSVFSTGADAVNDQTVKTTLTPLSTSEYKIYDVLYEFELRSFLQTHGLTWRRGRSYYELMKREEIQADKEILVLEKATGKVYGGPEARKLIRLPDLSVKITPDRNPKYTIFVQSNSTNRKLVPDTKLIILA